MTARLGPRRIADPSGFGRVAVLMGGWSAEREVSLVSGRAVHDALRESGVDAHALDVDHDVLDRLQDGDFDRAFIVVHGRGGEDGVLQGALDTLGLPYTGSGVLGSALAMDKRRSKLCWLGADLPTPPFRMLDSEQDCASAVEALGLPLIVKPVQEGSSIGMSKVEAAGELVAAWEQARGYGEVMCERWVDGEEYTCGVLDGAALPLIGLQTPRAFYDYEAKYHAEDTVYRCPCGLPAAVEQELQQLSLAAFALLGASGWGRVDFMLDGQRRPFLIEVNTVPGMTDHSLVPMAAAQAGLDFAELVWRVLETSISEGPS